MWGAGSRKHVQIDLEYWHVYAETCPDDSRHCIIVDYCQQRASSDRHQCACPTRKVVVNSDVGGDQSQIPSRVVVIMNGHVLEVSSTVAACDSIRLSESIDVAIKQGC
jgi:hypothetical protein